MVDLIPREMAVGGVLLPPGLVVGLLGLVAASAAAKVLNRTRLSRFFLHPPLAFLAMWVLFSALAGLCLVAP